MLQSIRDRSASWGAKIIIGAVVVAMALFGAESLVGLLGGNDGDSVAKVNGESIPRQQLELEVQRAIRSGQVPPEQERELRSQMLDSLISERLLTQYAEEGGLHLSESQIDQLIVNLPEFQDQDGKFSRELFRNRLSSAGFTPLAFRDQLRADMKRRQLQQGLAVSEFSLESEERRLAALQRQTRSFRHHALTVDDLESRPEASEQELQAYYEAHADDYQRPEQVKLAYVVLDREQMAEQADVSEQDLRDAWNAEAAEADRRVSHIMVRFGDQRTRQEAEARLEEVRQRLADGASFADLAAEYSDDTSTSDEGGDLGVISRGFFGEAFDEAAFSLGEGQVSDIVETDNGLHLIKVTELDRPSFEESRDRLARQVARKQVSTAFDDRAQRLIDESFAAEDLQSVAEELNLERKTTDWVSRQNVSGVLAEPGVMRQAFTPDVLEEGFNSEVIELDEDRRMVLRVLDHREATTLPLEEVRSQVVEAVQAQKTREALENEADRLIEALRSGETPAIDWQRTEGLSRQDDTDLAQPVVDAAFRLPHPEADETVYGRAIDGQRVVLIALDEVAEGQVDEQSEAFVARMAQQLRSQAAVNGLLGFLREQAEIKRF
ncbi:SurA N-terminal domain-containing protein [Halomonas elongata]|uniref:Periplasmic chaperone PpiD n=1 Tax=Halomonas elongata (strain ATCC 33173 / DSM 2581 / NBRC 15536 / NCIMB 2198 / 1H9) TaxID=768066 RepID=E1VBW4_HALED|nr:SurA N-terminal domain-containing protein [Halomonas elongata]WBF19508.1 SurA N-terminal domain-containing protein [Halomonas elongata]WPU48369.1 SurA N-terminal domain-containing protein [Halomonas elongata DSM 2581]WVI72956.1 SurA N-terminal domain-containing protein [Halomonas elongata]CBV42234.1 PpiC-type peptidyl-prolyl cis-trans isomerase [Halomonas elongata DSM 2581]